MPLSRVPAVVVVVFIALAAMACDGMPGAEGAPSADPPTVRGGQSAPPPAWVDTGDRSQWMAYGSYCWGPECIDMAPADARDDIPTVTVRPGQPLTFHFGFDPSEVSLRSGDDPGGFTSLASEPVTSWEVEGTGGLIHLLVRPADSGGDAQYYVQLVLETATTPTGG